MKGTIHSSLILAMFVSQVVSQCTYRGIVESNTAEGCVDAVKPAEQWKPGDPFSFGGIDDFCLVTGTSQPTGGKFGIPTVRQNGSTDVYEGVGNEDFSILNKLVDKVAWSYNADNLLQSSSINFEELKNNFYAAYWKEVTGKRAYIKWLEGDYQNRQNIKEKFETGIDFLLPDGTNITFRGADAPLQRAEDRKNAKEATFNSECPVYPGTSCGPSQRCKRCNIDPSIPRGPRGQCGSCVIRTSCSNYPFPGFSPCDQFSSTCAKACEEYHIALRRYDSYHKGVLNGSLGITQTDIDKLKASADQNEINLAPYKELMDHLVILKHETPDFGSPNPYYVEASAIKVGKEILKNYLHFRVFSNRSDSDSLNRLHSPYERKDNIRGRIKAIIIMVKDQDGWPIGDFSHPIPCEKTCSHYGRKGVYSHHESNDIPCAYTPPTATIHPGIFVFPKDGEESDEGYREIHATWSFSQSSCHFVTEIHVQTLIIEDFKARPGPDSYIGINVPKMNTSEVPVKHIYGWTARYDLLHPTKQSLGAPDFVNMKRMKERNRRKSDIDCHVPLIDEYGFVKGIAPSGRQIPSRADYLLALTAEYKGSTIDGRIAQYFGQHLTGHDKCRAITPTLTSDPGKAAAEGFIKLPDVQEFIKTDGILCPCPQNASTPRPEDQTPDPSRLHGRLLHGSHMAMAWLVLVPLSWFVIRYYKETFSSVFCLQEYWWYMWHVCLLLTAAVFGWGGFLSIMSRDTHVKLENSYYLDLHTGLGYFSFCLFYFQILFGFLRASRPTGRKVEIMVHFLLGLLNQVSAVAGVLLVGQVKKSGMTCNAMYIVGFWLLFCIAMFAFMEVHLRIVDKKLKLDPPRSYLPPPVKRLFGQDAPGRVFRIVMLGLFIIGLLALYLALIHAIWTSEGESCFDQIGEVAGDEEEEAEEIKVPVGEGEDEY